MTSACALFRASNVLTMDYPYAEAIASALAFCDEAVIVVGPSFDATRDAMYTVQAKHGADRVKVIEREWQFDLLWQERVWAWGAEQTAADWLACIDLDDIVHEADAPRVREAMERPGAWAITFPMIHLYGTPRWRECQKFYSRHTRIGRRDMGFRMVNLRTPATPNHPACCLMMDIDGQAVDLNAWPGPERELIDVPLYHYGWVRDARALAISQAKHFGWYANGGGLEDGHIPDVEPYNYAMASVYAEGRLCPYNGPYPSVITDSKWFAAHKDEWELRDVELSTARNSLL